MYCLLIYISWIQTEFKCYASLYLIFTRNLWANASICSDAMKTLFPKSLKKADLLRGLLCVPPHRPLWRHWCYPEGWTRAPRRPPAAAAAEMWVAAHCGQRRCAPSSTLYNALQSSADSQLIPEARPCGTLPWGLTTTDCFLISKLIGRQLGILHTVFWVEHKSWQALGSPRA